MNFCEDSSSGLKAKREELLTVCFHTGHNTHFIRCIQACSRDGQYASASPTSPLKAPCQHAKNLHGWGRARSLRHISRGERALPPSLTLDRETCFNGMAVITDTQPPTARKWICATTTRRTVRYLLVPEALCTHGLHVSHLWSHVPYLAYPSISLKQLACHGVTSRDTWLFV